MTTNCGRRANCLTDLTQRQTCAIWRLRLGNRAHAICKGKRMLGVKHYITGYAPGFFQAQPLS